MKKLNPRVAAFGACGALCVVFVARSICSGQETKQGFVDKTTLEDATSASIDKWEEMRGVTVSQGARDLVVSQLGDRADSFESQRKNLEFSVSDYERSVDASTFEYLDAALKIQWDQGRGPGGLGHGEAHIAPIVLSRRSVGKVSPALVATFLNDSDGFGWLTLTSVPSNGEISVDGKFEGYTGTTLGLSAGRHAYEIDTLTGSSCRDQIQVVKGHRYSRACPQGSNN